MQEKSSKISGFYKLSIDQRINAVKEFSNLEPDEVKTLKTNGSLDIGLADHLIENVITTLEIPMGIATNFKVNGRDYLIPMAVEEPSVVAACSHAAKLARDSGGFTSYSTDPVMIGQIQIIGLKSLHDAKMEILRSKEKILELANTRSKTLKSLGAGAKDIEVRIFERPFPMVVAHLLVDVRDAMGANAVNSMCEYVAPFMEEITGGRVNLRILSNLTSYRMSYSRAIFSKDSVGGPEAVDSIISAYEFAYQDPYRAATHNKGIMNGIDSVLLATLNDWRAVEAGAHAYAAISGSYTSLTKYEKNANGDLVVTIEIPLSVGTVGGSTGTVLKAKIARKILNVQDSGEFANVLAAVGIAQNFAAVKALATEGIQRGHMELHARNLAVTAGATGSQIEEVVAMMLKEKNISMSYAKELVERMSKKPINRET